MKNGCKGTKCHSIYEYYHSFTIISFFEALGIFKQSSAENPSNLT